MLGTVEELKRIRLRLRENHKELEKKIEDLKEKNASKDVAIASVVECFEKGAAISVKLDTSLNKSSSRDESVSNAVDVNATISQVNKK